MKDEVYKATSVSISDETGKTVYVGSGILTLRFVKAPEVPPLPIELADAIIEERTGRTGFGTKFLRK